MLTRPWITPLIIAFWAVSMHWLVTSKVTPSLASGAPPGHQVLYASNNQLVPVAWTVLWNDSPVGYAISRTERTPDHGLLVNSLMHFDLMPLDEMLPAWLKMMTSAAANQNITLPFDASGKVSLDARGRLRSFDSKVAIPGTADHITFKGKVDQDRVHVVVNAHGIPYEVDREMPEGVMIGDELSPLATMPGLSVNRRWTVPIYSPLRPGDTPIELLHAHVTGEQSFFWKDHLVRVHEVCYRDDPTAPHHDPRFTMLVDMDGRVLKQDSILLGAKLTFVRRSDEEAAQLATALDERPQEATAGQNGAILVGHTEEDAEERDRDQEEEKHDP